MRIGFATSAFVLSLHFRLWALGVLTSVCAVVIYRLRLS